LPCLAGFPRKDGMLRKDLIEKNAAIFSEQGKAIEQYASRDIKVIVIANPANTNCFILRSNAPSVPAVNFTALTFLGESHEHSTCVGNVLSYDRLRAVAWPAVYV